MVSRRNFFSIIIMMAVLLFMFQFSQVIKEGGNNYDLNEFVMEEPLSGADSWNGERLVTGETNQRAEVLFLGNEENELGDMVSSWCAYSKRRLKIVPNTDNYNFEQDGAWELILIDSDNIDFSREADNIVALAGKGIPLVFCNLPKPSVIEEHKELARLLGISEVRQDRVQVKGVHLFSGFLLGGEAFYQVQLPEEEKLQDFNLLVPWYVTGKGTKTYMVGIMDEEEVKREEFPALIWRNVYEDTMIFAVNGDYMSGLTGMGLLTAMLYEMNPYVIYPVVNAQNAVVVDFPYFASENAAQLEELYSRSPRAVLRDVFWPGIVSLATNNKLKLTCCLSTKYNYTDVAAPYGDELPFYLQQMKEISAEAGRSFHYGEGITLEEKVKADNKFFDVSGSNYKFSAAYFEEIPEKPEELLSEENGLSDVRTIVCADRGELPVLSYIQDSVTFQGVTGVAGEYTYSMDFQLRSMATALGYSNLLIDMHNVRWPVSSEDRWEYYSDEVFSNISTYWTRFDAFEYTTLSESDKRVRTLLNLDYREESSPERILLSISGKGDDAWFVLRLHGQEITKLVNGEFEELEAGVYLIHALEPQVEIYLGRAEEILKYSGAFAQ